MTTTSPSARETFSIDIDGGGNRFPSVLMPPREAHFSSSIRLPAILPSSSTPSNRYPVSPLPEISLAKAHTACPILSALSKARVRSTCSLSKAEISFLSSCSIICRPLLPYGQNVRYSSRRSRICFIISTLNPPNGNLLSRPRTFLSPRLPPSNKTLTVLRSP